MFFRICVNSEATRKYGSGRRQGTGGSWWVGKGCERDLVCGSTCCAKTPSFRRLHPVAGTAVRASEWDSECTVGRIIRIKEAEGQRNDQSLTAEISRGLCIRKSMTTMCG
jgi:hypothetical protein